MAVDSIIQCLTQVSQTITPNAIMEQLKPLLRASEDTRSWHSVYVYYQECMRESIELTEAFVLVDVTISMLLNKL